MLKGHGKLIYDVTTTTPSMNDYAQIVSTKCIFNQRNLSIAPQNIFLFETRFCMAFDFLTNKRVI